MPTIFTHPAVILGLCPWLKRVPRGLLTLAAICTVVPDADVLSFAIGIPYSDPLGHRGFTHSILFAGVLAALAAAAYRKLINAEVSFVLAFALLFVAAVSHGVLDAMTNGGQGVGFLIPFSNERFFMPFRPIRVSPIAVGRFAARARVVLASEARWVWLPFLGIAACGVAVRVASRRKRSARGIPD